ncbi:LacI family DNA-binding transcriptional regulator [Hymenobacter latericus]|uniref:LacI family DNA-binding transcriptional regulator n=1 Tax=Hymenobacter sp. YIM 151858-1 TaxID=2987688 RepID=UPI00222748F3|nr:LacI family DNA-binding transcriptional regulator [Hymenobacter sp. YIM 151858-1]UYZ60171.1 LacI family DNA-binding transcriptional regulator [Hymenobacter sp. YIM 151858-1]
MNATAAKQIREILGHGALADVATLSKVPRPTVTRYFQDKSVRTKNRRAIEQAIATLLQQEQQAQHTLQQLIDRY